MWVDPLDGTREYVEGNLEHVTVMIGTGVQRAVRYGHECDLRYGRSRCLPDWYAATHVRYGQCSTDGGYAATRNRSQKCTSGWDHTCALREAGTVACIGLCDVRYYPRVALAYAVCSTDEEYAAPRIKRKSKGAPCGEL